MGTDPLSDTKQGRVHQADLSNYAESATDRKHVWQHPKFFILTSEDTEINSAVTGDGSLGES